MLVAFDGVEAIDVAGPASIFSKAEAMHPGSYRVHVASPGGGTVATSGSLSLGATRALAQLPDPVDTLIVAAGDARRGAYFRSPAPWVSIAAGFAVLAPHLAWVAANGVATFGYALASHRRPLRCAGGA